MKTAFVSVTFFLAITGVALAADEKSPSIEGEYTLVTGKKFGMKIDEESTKAKYTIDATKITIDGPAKFVIGYKLNTKAKPMAIEMEILEGPEGTKGEKSLGIVERSGDTLKLAYSLEKNKRPKDFEGKEDMYFLFKLKQK